MVVPGFRESSAIDTVPSPALLAASVLLELLELLALLEPASALALLALLEPASALELLALLEVSSPSSALSSWSTATNTVPSRSW